MSTLRLRAAKAVARAAADLRNQWKGETVVCLAGGPSLTVEDCELVRATGWRVIVVNATFHKAPWADVLYGMDRAFWKAYNNEIIESGTEALRVGWHPLPHRFGMLPMKAAGFRSYNNSGAGAVALAHFMGATRIMLLGYDLCHSEDGRAHHHPDHPPHLGNARLKSIAKWKPSFKVLLHRLREAKVETVNCSRRTELEWPRAELEGVLDVWNRSERAGEVPGDLGAAGISGEIAGVAAPP